MKKSFVVMAALGLILIWFAQTLSAPPAEVYRITPPEGQAGQTAVIHGSALKGGNFEIKFGQAIATNPHNPGNSSQNIKMTIPPKEPSDLNIVDVTVKIDGVPALTPPGGLRFEYIE